MLVLMGSSLFFINDFEKAYAASGVGQARLVVPGSLIIVKTSDLDFGAAMPGDARKRVTRASADVPDNATFEVYGIAGSTITISIPPGSIFLSHATSGDQLEVNRFRSRPNGTGRIRNTGQRTIFVGADRLAIPLGVASGLYTGVFTVDVVY